MIGWLENIKSQSVSLIKTDKIISKMTVKMRDRNKHINYIEAAICAIIVDNFKHCGVDPKNITIVTPFLAQSDLLKEHLIPYGGPKVMTIDKA